MAIGMLRRGFLASSPVISKFTVMADRAVNDKRKFTGGGDGVEALESEEAGSGASHDTGKSKR